MKSDFRKVLVVANPVARRNAPRLLEELQQASPGSVEWTVIETKPAPLQRGELEREAREANLLITVGGDGTATEALTAIGDVDVPLAIVPGGSTNVIAQELDVPNDPAALAHLIFGEHQIRTMDAAMCNDRLFLHMAGAGFDSRIFDATDAGLKRRVGWLAYLPSAAQSLRLPPARFHVETESARFELTSPMVLVANGAGIIRPSLYVYPGISSDDGWLDLIAVTATAPRAIASVLARFASRSMQRSPHVLHAKARRIRIEAEPRMPVQVDGDVIGTSPAEIFIMPKRARIIVPARAEQNSE
jgi:YegS/Rv2252/BmrU family lipid kinase